MLEIYFDRRQSFRRCGPEIFAVHFIEEDGAVKTHPAAGAAQDADRHGQKQISDVAPAPDREPIEVIGEEPLSENDQRQIADAHAGDRKTGLDEFGASMPIKYIHETYGFTAEAICNKVLDLLKK